MSSDEAANDLEDAQFLHHDHDVKKEKVNKLEVTNDGGKIEKSKSKYCSYKCGVITLLITNFLLLLVILFGFIWFSDLTINFMRFEQLSSTSTSTSTTPKISSPHHSPVFAAGTGCVQLTGSCSVDSDCCGYQDWHPNGCSSGGECVEYCFSSKDMVNIFVNESYHQIKLDDIKLGDKILAVNGQSGEFQLETVIGKVHYLKEEGGDILTPMIKIKLINENEITLTSDHLIYASDEIEFNSFKLIPAGKVKQGQYIWSGTGTGSAIKVIEIEQGLNEYPRSIDTDGDNIILVNNIAASTSAGESYIDHLFKSMSYKMVYESIVFVSTNYFKDPSVVNDELFHAEIRAFLYEKFGDQLVVSQM